MWRPQARIGATTLDQLAVCARFDNSARIHDKDLVTGNDALEPVCDQHDRALPLQHLQATDQKLLIVLIESTCWFIQDEERRPG
jgi:hypothetical protein